MFRNLFRKSVLTLGLALVPLLSPVVARAQYTNGIYAEFNTSMGSFTCALYYAYAPKAVANFIGLATGKRPWLDLSSGLARTNPFYNGLTFHRVVTNFVIQAGSPNGLGTDGPGYAFVDEITNALQFDRFGVLAMANTGLDSNGSQFFVLATNNWPSLNNGYTVFGRLYGGSNVVYAINRVATDASSKPLVNVYINSVKIVTNGSAATAFNIYAQGLPVVTNINLGISTSLTNITLAFSNRLYAENRLYSSSNLMNWSPGLLGIETSVPLTQTNLQSINATAQFYRMAQIQYATSTRAPKLWYGKTLTLFYTNGLIATNVISFNSSGGGTYVYSTNSPGTVISYNWSQGLYRGQIVPMVFSTLADQAVGLQFTRTNAGYFSGGVYPWGYPNLFFAFGISGTFTNSP